MSYFRRYHAWGKDQLLPLSKGSEEWLALGLTLVDSLDTLLLMNMTAEFAEARRWVAEHLDVDQVIPIGSVAHQARRVPDTVSRQFASPKPSVGLSHSIKSDW